MLSGGQGGQTVDQEIRLSQLLCQGHGSLMRTDRLRNIPAPEGDASDIIECADKTFRVIEAFRHPACRIVLFTGARQIASHHQSITLTPQRLTLPGQWR